MKKVLFAIVLVLLGLAVWWTLSSDNQIRNLIGQYVENGEILTLEAKYTPEQIMEAHRRELLIDDQHTYQQAAIKFYPYLLMEVKYTQPDKKTREGVILWSMVDGEMLIDTDTWEKTHGFEDALIAGATKEDFKIINTLAKNRGTLTKDHLLKELQLEPEVADNWIERAREKHLITQRGNTLLLHFQNPTIVVTPHTKISQHLVTKPYNHEQRTDRKYSQSQIEKTAKAAFGPDFTIRRSIEVFLPVYSLEVLNPDGSILTSHWNALSGERIIPNYLMVQTQEP